MVQSYSYKGAGSSYVKIQDASHSGMRMRAHLQPAKKDTGSDSHAYP